MAFLLVNRRRERVPLIFRERQELGPLRDYDITNYRFPRHIIDELVQQYSLTDFANTTTRSHAISPETEVVICKFKTLSYLPVMSVDSVVSRSNVICVQGMGLKQILLQIIAALYCRWRKRTDYSVVSIQ